VSVSNAVDASLFCEGDTLALAGSRCRSCATVTFPRQVSCPRCAGTDVEAHALAGDGTIWAFTEQLFPPKSPYAVQGADFRPYVVGYVELGGEVIVESRILGASASLRIGQAVTLVTEAFVPGSDVVTFAFTPTEEPIR
jgi:uncharacterized OB-fold protein